MSSNIQVNRICEFCGSEFIARTITTRYCSPQCNKKAYKANLRQSKIETVKKETEAIKNKPLDDLNNREFLKVSQTAKLLGCCRKTVYNLIHQGLIPATNIGIKQTIIRRSDIDNLFNSTVLPENKAKYPKPEAVNEWYGLNEIYEKYRVSQKALYNMIRKHNIPKIQDGIFVFVSKNHIDNLLQPVKK